VNYLSVLLALAERSRGWHIRNAPPPERSRGPVGCGGDCSLPGPKSLFEILAITPVGCAKPAPVDYLMETLLAKTKSELFFYPCTEKGLTFVRSQPFLMKLLSS
jgi:hypothetical protein